jgi:hypothetical protein
MLFSQILVRPRLPSGHSSFGIPAKILYAFLFSHMHAEYGAHLILFDLPHLDSNISHSNLFSNTLILFNVREQISHQYKTTGKIIVLYILVFRQQRRRQTVLNFNGSKHYPNLIFLNDISVCYCRSQIIGLNQVLK